MIVRYDQLSMGSFLDVISAVTPPISSLDPSRSPGQVIYICTRKDKSNIAQYGIISVLMLILITR